MSLSPSKNKMALTTNSITKRIKPGRKIEGISAVLLPFRRGGIDFDSFAENVRRTLAAGLAPAINMDTGYTNFLSPAQRREVLRVASDVCGKKSFIAGAFVEGLPGEALANYQRAIAEIQQAGGAPILFQCSAWKKLGAPRLIRFYEKIAATCEKFLAFELGEMFAPFGQIYSLETVAALMRLPQLIGLKHSSLNRQLEWHRLDLRDRVRPDFKIYTGNDLAIDMVMYGSDYLLGLSAFCPEAFALRDKFWAKSDPRFYELNDLLQYLGHFAFRPPVPAYKHSAAQFLKLRGRIRSDSPHPQSQRRRESDLEILEKISHYLDELVGADVRRL